MRSVLRVGLAMAALAALPAAAQQQDFSKVEMKVIPVSGSVYMLQGAGGNIGVSAGPDGILIVDDQYAPLAEKIRAALKGINPGKLKFVLNTHWHGDHTGSNAAFSSEAPILAHENVRKRMATLQRVFGEDVPPSPAEALPVVTYADAVSVHFNGEEIKAVHYPHGHTDGDSIIFFPKSNVIHMGDDFFANRFPFVDLASGGNVLGLMENIAKVIAEAPAGVKIIPGHGPLSTVDDLKKFHRMLVDSTAAVQKGIQDGKTLEQVQEAGLPEEWKDWGSGFITTKLWLSIVYECFTKGEAETKETKHH